jgi:hypothetical protein
VKTENTTLYSASTTWEVAEKVLENTSAELTCGLLKGANLGAGNRVGALSSCESTPTFGARLLINAEERATTLLAVAAVLCTFIYIQGPAIMQHTFTSASALDPFYVCNTHAQVTIRFCAKSRFIMGESRTLLT